jgi:hypothetical protein
VIALAGRRIASGTVSAFGEDGFPLDRVAMVAARLRATFQSLRGGTLLCSAANGADLTALRVARELGMRRRIVLPFSVARFRSVSVTDRPGGELWGWLFDELVADARASDELIVLRPRGGHDADAFVAATARIVEEARQSAGAKGHPVGVAVWDGVSRGRHDATAAFGARMRDAGYAVRDVRVGA